MPVKVKKQKQKQKQSQKQIVNIKIGERIRQAKRRRAGRIPLIQQTVQPVQYLYQASAPQPFQSMGVSQPARPNILGGEVLEPEEIRQRRQEPVKQLGIGQFSAPREALLRQKESPLEAIPEEGSVATRLSYGDIFGSASSASYTNPMISGGGSVVSGITDLPSQSGRTPRLYKNKPTLIREILRASSSYTAEQLQNMNTFEVRTIYDKFYK
jgi:hypothetical protein